MKKVSVIITNYNYGRFLKEAIESALAQNYENYEIIIVDDGSTDNSRAILQKYKKNTKIRMILQENKGLPAACNAGINSSNGQYIVRLDADDKFLPIILKKESEILNKNPDVGMVYCDHFRNDKLVNVPEFDTERLRKEHYIIPGGTMLRRSCIDSVGLFRDTFWEETDMWIRIAKHFKIFHLKEPLYFYRRHDKNMTQGIYPY